MYPFIDAKCVVDFKYNNKMKSRNLNSFIKEGYFLIKKTVSFVNAAAILHSI